MSVYYVRHIPTGSNLPICKLKADAKGKETDLYMDVRDEIGERSP